MCYHGCIYENWDGECCKPKHQTCPDEMEDLENDFNDEEEDE